VLDPDGQPTPIGVPGELYVGGDGLAWGYLDRPALSAERFVPDPFSHPEGSRPGARLYRTGDLVRWRPDGRLEFLGRIDQQVKLRGFRIELGEISAALAQHAGVREAVVLLRPSASGDRQLVAYLTADPAAGLDPAALRDHLQRVLPPYMIPAALVILDALPLTPNGKLDQQRLLTLTSEPLGAEPDYLEPRTPIEQQVAAMWQALLQAERVGIRDNFFETGGHSLLAIQLLTEINEAFGVTISMRSVFDTPTVEGLALEIVTQLAMQTTTADDLEAVLSSLEEL
jgi:acyl carrier protein